MVPIPTAYMLHTDYIHDQVIFYAFWVIAIAAIVAVLCWPDDACARPAAEALPALFVNHSFNQSVSQKRPDDACARPAAEVVSGVDANADVMLAKGAEAMGSEVVESMGEVMAASSKGDVVVESRGGHWSHLTTEVAALPWWPDCCCRPLSPNARGFVWGMLVRS